MVVAGFLGILSILMSSGMENALGNGNDETGLPYSSGEYCSSQVSLSSMLS